MNPEYRQEVKLCSCSAAITLALVLAPLLGLITFKVAELIGLHHGMGASLAAHRALEDAVIAAVCSPGIAQLILCGIDFWFYSTRVAEQRPRAASDETDKG